MSETSPIGSVFGRTPQPTSQPTQKSGVSFMDVLEATDKFMEYQKMTPAQKFRASYLAEKGLTEEDVQKMSFEDRQKLEAEIAEKIRKKITEAVNREADEAQMRALG